MSESCNHDCSSCASKSSCSSSSQDGGLLKCKPNRYSKIKKVIGVVSGKGGVGKSSVTSMLAVLMRRMGYKTAILDADITGPSIPKAFGIKEKAVADEEFLFPVISKTGIEIMSINLLLEDESSPVVWRGPVLAGAVKQFFEEVSWNEVDYMFVDMPPGTGDVPLTVFQSLPLDGIIVVTTPQDLVSMVVEKAVKMANLMKIKVLALVENMSYFVCPNCKEKHHIFGESRVESEAKRLGIECFDTLPIDSELAKQEDAGLIELFEGDYLTEVVKAIDKI
ncbi:MAG: Mrp/NBP35 family ATP-binding protein [Clostridia bacterium]|nr:Mrp/NBP35 family ATP-binding protein [Clostridia bacterium]